MLIFRLERKPGQSIRYNTLMLLPYKAKAREYKKISVREILDDKLAGTPIKYKLLNKRIDIVQCTDGRLSYKYFIRYKKIGQGKEVVNLLKE